MTAKVSDYTTVIVSRRLNTVGLLHECAAVSPATEYGTRLPMYAVLHRALEEYKERHGAKAGEKKAGRFGPG